ncbi:MAG: hypothetical protein P9L92_03210 [Candidatus Electryonea clarkiae]|nr:hypothetical protein [Candidatus Electryonea clarkiae]MDP8286755.1 hypothetical protein [Candidatus Electryonea clarkiae]
MWKKLLLAVSVFSLLFAGTNSRAWVWPVDFFENGVETHDVEVHWTTSATRSYSQIGNEGTDDANIHVTIRNNDGPIVHDHQVNDPPDNFYFEFWEDHNEDIHGYQIRAAVTGGDYPEDSYIAVKVEYPVSGGW